MRQQNNGRRRQNRGSNRRSFNGGNLNGNINKYRYRGSGPDGRQEVSNSVKWKIYFSASTLLLQMTGS